MKKLAAIFAIMSLSSSAFALSSEAIVEALRVTTLENITSITENKDIAVRCMCEMVQVKGTTKDGGELTQTIAVEHTGNGKMKAIELRM